MYPHRISNIYHLKSCIWLNAAFAATIAAAEGYAAAAKPASLLSRGGSTAIVFCLYSVLLHLQRFAPVFPLCNAQIAVAAAMTGPTAALGVSSRASRMAVALFQRLLPCSSSVIAAALLSQNKTESPTMTNRRVTVSFQRRTPYHTCGIMLPVRK